MPRIFGVDIPREKRTEIALTYLYGIGRPISNKVLKAANVDPNKRAKDLSDKEVAQITATIQKFNLKVEGDLRRENQQNIKRLIDIRSYRGSRHLKGLPVHGQRTHTNARTRKGPRKTVGGLLKKPPGPK
ncbi:MAG: 30S ribosomal protein S13 [Omnitrophica bacterium RIFCSPHIGHO2_02_FULL_46_11]|nr:MAG: 30S ribosomal protein S13 [Omnitrophica bacterium RIFCSPLOWO2_01_FULL_45_10b]OGW86519.1 MAG: 30S ribosomal protein S13 [Omnitrophica bacterium RIFCSPHIGHO2_02_FULL_46_11]